MGTPRNNASLSQHESTTQTPSRSVLLFLHRSQQNVVGQGMPFFLKKLPIRMRQFGSNQIYDSLGPPESTSQTVSLSVQPVFARPSNMDGSTVSPRWRQCAPHVTHASQLPWAHRSPQHKRYLDWFSHFCIGRWSSGTLHSPKCCKVIAMK